MILAYLGPEEPPLVPNYQFPLASHERRISTKAHMD